MEKKPKNNVNGFLLINKDPGWTSTQVVSTLKFLLNAKKAGHGGTLDPFASGVIPIFFGENTKFSRFFLDAYKSYEATVKLGFSSSTGDTEGDIQKDENFLELRKSINSDFIQKILEHFKGNQEQKPPIYSALKFKGKPYYEYARMGEEIPIKHRKIHIKEIGLISFKEDEIIFKVTCSKGTYVRTLGEDIAKKIGTKGYLTSLKRLKLGQFDISNSISIAKIESIDLNKRLAQLSEVDRFIELEKLYLAEIEVRKICQGQKINKSIPDGEYLLYQSSDAEVKFIGIGEVSSKELIAKRLKKTN
jgi:tRNA pseudouridine55 synthase